jgi:hypothetical protein
MINKQSPLPIEVVAHVTGSLDHCAHCQVFINGAGIGEQVHQHDLRSFPADFIRDWQSLAAWIQELAATFPGQLVIRVTDAQSLRGLWLALTRGARRYPTFLIGEQKMSGWDRDQLDQLIRLELGGGSM